MVEPEADKVLRLAEILSKKTGDGGIKWDYSDPSDDKESYEYSTPNGTVRVEKFGMNDYISMNVLNSHDIVVASLEISESTKADVDEVLNGLFLAVRRQVLRIDETLDELIRELEH